MKTLLTFVLMASLMLMGCVQAAPHMYKVYEIHRTAWDTGADLLIHIRVDVTAGTSCSLDAGTYAAYINGKFLDACKETR
jgi:hypothetical protein